MSQENVELTYDAVDAWNRGDLDGLLACMADDVEVHSLLVAMEGNYRGHEGVRRWWENLYDVFPDWNTEVAKVRDHGDFTFGAVRMRGHAGESGAPVDQTIWQVAEWRSGKCVRLSSHNSEEEALEAAGLRE